MSTDPLRIANQVLESRLFLGSGKFASSQVMAEALAASGTQLVTVALRRVEREGRPDPILSALDRQRYCLMPNTSGARTAAEAVLAAQLGRDALETAWVKLEIHPDPRHLMPDPVETLAAAGELVRLGFIVLPYIHADPVLAKRLEEVGVAAVMPLAAPIGSNLGLAAAEFLRLIIDQATVPVVVDAGLGAPSHAAAALELGADAVLVNTAIAAASDPVAMATAFRMGVQAGRLARLAGLAETGATGQATSPLTAFLDQGADVR